MNTIKIKHGTGDPSGKLQAYELGFNDEDGALYIGLPDGAVQSLTSGYLPLSGGVIDGSLTINKNLDVNQKLIVNENLIANQNLVVGADLTVGGKLNVKDELVSESKITSSLFYAPTLGFEEREWCGSSLECHGLYFANDVNNESEWWQKGIQFFDNYTTYEHLGTIAMTGLGRQVQSIYFGYNPDDYWLRINPNFGIQTHSIVLNPYDAIKGIGSYGYEDPNEANIPGVKGQIYFMLAAETLEEEVD